MTKDAAGQGSLSNQSDAEPTHVTLAIDEPPSEYRFVEWLKAGGARVEHNADNEDVLYDSPAARSILVRYRRMLRVRMNLIAANVLNMGTTEDVQGKPNPYRRQFVTVHPNGTYDIETDPSPFQLRHEPGHRDADGTGNVRYPNIDLATEQVNMLQASREYDLVSGILVRFDATYLNIDRDKNADPPVGLRPGVAGAVQ